MNKVGIVIYKNEIYYCVINNKLLIDIGMLTFNNESPTLISDFNNLFEELVTKYKPSTLSFKVPLNISKLYQYRYMYYPLGVLILVCENHDITCIERSSSWINSKNGYKIEEVKRVFQTQKFNEKSIQSVVLAYFD